jgi:hypothetical protein
VASCRSCTTRAWRSTRWCGSRCVRCVTVNPLFVDGHGVSDPFFPHRTLQTDRMRAALQEGARGWGVADPRHHGCAQRGGAGAGAGRQLLRRGLRRAAVRCGRLLRDGSGGSLQMALNSCRDCNIARSFRLQT